MKNKTKNLPDRFKWLIVIDLDGTLLSSGSTFEKLIISKTNIEAIKKMIEIGHKVAIVTGRPWTDTEKIYSSLGLETIVGNYNGSLISDPHDVNFTNMSVTINRNIVKEVLKTNVIKKHFENLIVQDEVGPAVLKKEEFFMNQFHILNNPNVRLLKNEIDINKNPYSVVIQLNCEKDETFEIIQELKRKFGWSLNMRFWSKDVEKKHFLEINALSINKSVATRKIAGYYNIPMYRTIAFGDGLNDIEMLSDVAYGVAMKNASETVKSYANDITDYDNDHSGVGKFLYKFFKYDLKN